MNHAKRRAKSCLILAYHFPPQLTAGTHRTRAVVRHLPRCGWKPVVVTVTPAAEDAVDPALLEDMPADLACYRTSWLDIPRLASRVKQLWTVRPPAPSPVPTGAPSGAGIGQRGGWLDWLSWWLQVPDSRLGWLPAGLLAGLRAIQRHRCQAIYSTAPYWTAHLIGLALHRLTGLTWAADFRDPWRASPFRAFPYASSDRWDRWLERQVIHHARAVICNTPNVERDFARRYPDCAGRFVTILNGYEPEELADLTPHRLADRQRFVLTHAGDFYGCRRPEPILRAVQLLRERDAGAAARLLLQFVGKPDHEGESLQTLAERFQVSALVSVQGSVSRRTALERLAGSDGLLIVGFAGAGGELQIPSKVYEYIGLGKPILALVPSNSPIADVLRFTRADAMICEPDQPAAVAEALRRLLHQPATKRTPVLREELTRAYQTQQIAALLERRGPSARRSCRRWTAAAEAA